MAVAGAGALAYASVVERNWFTLRQAEVPVLAPGTTPIRVLHISDVHLTPRRTRLMSWLASLDRLEPDLVVNTGDSIAHPEAVRALVDSLGPLLDRPGIFVYGSNDLYRPTPKNPARYLWETSARRYPRNEPDLPWQKLGDAMANRGWLDANNHQGQVKAGGLNIAVAGVHDPHLKRDRYDRVAGPPIRRPTCGWASCTPPSPGSSTASPPTVTTSCSPATPTVASSGSPATAPWSPTARSTGTGSVACTNTPRLGNLPWTATGPGCTSRPAWHLPWAPVRFACRPEATMLTLVPRAAD